MNTVGRCLVITFLLALVVGVVPSRASATTCHDQCHSDHTSGGGGCTPVTDEERRQESDCEQRCEDDERTTYAPIDSGPRADDDAGAADAPTAEDDDASAWPADDAGTD